MATRKFSQACLNAIGNDLPTLMGESVDLTPSNLTSFGEKDFQKSTPVGRYVGFGVREQGMCAISNGIFAHRACYLPHLLRLHNGCHPAILQSSSPLRMVKRWIWHYKLF